MVLGSPSLWWDGGIVARYEETFAANHKALRVRIFEGESHLSTFPVALTRGLRTVFAARPNAGTP